VRIARKAMRGISPIHAVVGLVLMVTISSCFSSEQNSQKQPSKYLDAVSEFADNVLKYGRDTYGPKHTPLFVDGLNIHNHEPVKWIASNGDRWILSNLASQQNLFRTLDGLTKITGDPKYKQAAVEAIEYAFANLRSPNGLLYWGCRAAYDAQGDKVCGINKHVLKSCYPHYELMWEVNSQATRQFIESFWAAHINDWSNLDMDRYGEVMNAPLEKPWDYEYKDGPVFFESVEPWGHSFLATGSDLFYAAAILSQLSGEKEPLVWAKRLAHRYVETRYPRVGISSVLYNLVESGGYQFSDDFDTVTIHKGSFFPPYPFHPFRPPTTDFPQPRIRPWICQFLVGERLDFEGQEFTQWALEELTAWGKVAYRKRDNSWIPMLIDGTKLEGYVLKRDGYFGVKGTVCKSWSARPVDFYAYSLAFRLTENQFMWDMARSIAAGLELGDLGLHAQCSDPYVVLAFLELHEKTGRRAFLQAAQRVGDNILRYRFQKGFFVPSKRHIYVRFDTLEPPILLHLDLAVHSKEVLVPQI
jgi:pectate lyase